MDGTLFQANDFLWKENQRLREENASLRAQLREREQRRQNIAQLQQRYRQVRQENRMLKQRIAELSQASPRVLPPFVKPNVPHHRRRKPGRPKGHEPALRPLPARIDQHQQVPLPRDDWQQPLCPQCRGVLRKLRRHQRIVEDLIRSTVQTICYDTQSGYCPKCHRRIESRSPEQPPAADVPHGQLGINTLATAAILRVRHRLPFRQITQLLADLPGLSVSPGGIVKQIKRLAKWLEGKYQELIRRMRASPHVHADETGWRIDGKNFWLWAFTDPTFTLYHVDASRGGKVPLKLLGKAFGGTVICDFYSAYNRLQGPKQRCLAHLMREVRETRQKDAGFADCPLSRKLLRWCREALRLKKRGGDLERACYELKVRRLEERLGRFIDAPWDHPDAQRLCKRLARHRQELTRFLWEADLDGTNNAAERAIRPAVVMRKITGGSRSLQGAAAWAKLASLLRSTDPRGLGVYDAAKKLILDYWAASGR
jgi:transposase